MGLLDQVNRIKLPSVIDARGVLTSIESEMDVPFAIERIFYMHHIVSERGGHAHIDTDQVIVTVAGSLKLTLSDGVEQKSFDMNDATSGLYIPRLVFIKISEISPDAVCLALASSHYDISKSIRSWEDYLKYFGYEQKE